MSVCFYDDPLMVFRHVGAVQGSEEWHKLRECSIGSSEAAAVFPTVSTTFTAKDLWRKLRGVPQPPPSPFLENLFREGTKMERVLRYEAEKVLDCSIIETGMFIRPPTGSLQRKYSASLDGICVRPGGGVMIIEFKWRTNPGAGWGANRDELGMTVFCQVQHQMMVVGANRALVYVGAVCGQRRMWLVTVNMVYRTVWERYLAKAIKDSESSAPPRAARGSGPKIREELHRMMALSVRPLPVPPLPPPALPAGRQ